MQNTFSGIGAFGEGDKTLLQALCEANGQQGGTIHQFFRSADFRNMAKSFADYTAAGITFESRASFDKLADQYGLTINWKGN